MDNRQWVAAWGIVIVGLGFLSMGGCAEDSRGKSYLLRHTGVTLAQASEIAERSTPGRAVRAELQHLRNAVVYQVEIIDIVNNSKMVAVDAETGKIVQ